MANGYLRLKVDELLEQFNARSLYNVSQRGQVAYPTLHRYRSKPEKVKAMSVRVLHGFLIDGLGVPPEELSELRFGDIFEVVFDEEPQDSDD